MEEIQINTIFQNRVFMRFFYKNQGISYIKKTSTSSRIPDDVEVEKTPFYFPLTEVHFFYVQNKQ